MVQGIMHAWAGGWQGPSCHSGSSLRRSFCKRWRRRRCRPTLSPCN